MLIPAVDQGCGNVVALSEEQVEAKRTRFLRNLQKLTGLTPKLIEETHFAIMTPLDESNLLQINQRLDSLFEQVITANNRARALKR